MGWRQGADDLPIPFLSPAFALKGKDRTDPEQD